MLRFHILNRHGLRFTLLAVSRKAACDYVRQMLGKRSMPSYITVMPA